VHDKWSLGGNRRISGFLFEVECLGFVERLRHQWDVVRSMAGRLSARDRKRMSELTGQSFEYFRLGANHWPLRLGPLGYVDAGRTHHEQFWWINGEKLVLAGSDGFATCELRRGSDDVWKGLSFRNPRQQCQLRPSECIATALVS
jgi:hypothetical protein